MPRSPQVSRDSQYPFAFLMGRVTSKQRRNACSHRPNPSSSRRRNTPSQSCIQQEGALESARWPDVQVRPTQPSCVPVLDEALAADSTGFHWQVFADSTGASGTCFQFRKKTSRSRDAWECYQNTRRQHTKHALARSKLCWSALANKWVERYIIIWATTWSSDWQLSIHWFDVRHLSNMCFLFRNTKGRGTF